MQLVFQSSQSQPVSLDILQTERLCRDLEQQHGIKAVKERVHPTAAYFQHLASKLREQGLKGCTATGAFIVWRAVFDTISEYRKEHDRAAELAFWYGLDPWQLSDEQKLGLLVNLPKVQAQETLHRGDYDPVDYAFIYDLVLLATGDRKRAVKARTAAMERYVDLKTRKGR